VTGFVRLRELIDGGCGSGPGILRWQYRLPGTLCGITHGPHPYSSFPHILLHTASVRDIKDQSFSAVGKVASRGRDGTSLETHVQISSLTGPGLWPFIRRSLPVPRIDGRLENRRRERNTAGAR
jgi:hypothetical protein